MEIIYNKELSRAPGSSTIHSSPCIPPCVPGWHQNKGHNPGGSCPGKS